MTRRSVSTCLIFLRLDVSFFSDLLFDFFASAVRGSFDCFSGVVWPPEGCLCRSAIVVPSCYVFSPSELSL